MPPKRPKKRASTVTTATTTDEDGTQVEKETKREKKQPRQKKSTLVQGNLKTALREFCLNTCKIGAKGLAEEFTKIREQTLPIGDKPKTGFDAHMDKNRYKDVYCIDATRVKLTFPEGGDDYIHANWVNGIDGKKRYICTQGPKENSVEEFWRMVWQEKCKSIVMLCNEMECGKRKCEKYWPDVDAEPKTLECKLTVKALKTEDLEKNITMTRLEMSDEGGTKHTVEHFQWKDWPDRGVPESSLSMFRLLNRVGKLIPSAVHCSAGIGRTGTVVGVDLMYSKLEKGEVCTLEKTVRDLRDQRHGSVQTDVQYVFMHRLLIAVAESKKAVVAGDIEKFVAEYDALVKARGN